MEQSRIPQSLAGAGHAPETPFPLHTITRCERRNGRGILSPKAADALLYIAGVRRVHVLDQAKLSSSHESQLGCGDACGRAHGQPETQVY